MKKFIYPVVLFSDKTDKTYTILFPKETREIRFMATHSNPEGLRNRGRIVLDNFHFESNVNFN